MLLCLLCCVGVLLCLLCCVGVAYCGALGVLNVCCVLCVVLLCVVLCCVLCGVLCVVFPGRYAQLLPLKQFQETMKIKMQREGVRSRGISASTRRQTRTTHV